MRISDWSSDVCSSDLTTALALAGNRSRKWEKVMISAALEPQQVRSQLPPATDSPTAPVLATGGKALLPVVRQNPNRKKVLFVTSEIADLVKNGGLGDVSSALPRAMAGRHEERKSVVWGKRVE